MSLRRLSINASAAVLQVLVVTVALATLYALMVKSIGMERVGIWSLVMSVVAFGKVGEVGLGTAIMQFAARHLNSDEACLVKPAVLSSAVSVVAATGVLAIFSLPLLSMLLGLLISDPLRLPEARMLLPYALLVMCQMALVTVFFGVIDAHQKSWLRSTLVAAASVLQITAAFWLLPKYGLMGLAWLQVAYAACLTAGGALIAGCLLRQSPGHWRWLPWQQFSGLLRFGAGLQISTIAQLFFDPCTKALITLFGGLTLTGYYEVANRAISQLKSIVVAAFQLLIPYIADRYPSSSDNLPQLTGPYRRVFALMQVLVCVFLPVLLAALPVLLPLWLVVDSSELVLFASICAIGWSINLLSVPAYMFSLASGHVRWTVESHLTMGVLNPIFSVLGGWLLGGFGVVIGAMSALALGSLTVIARFKSGMGGPLQDLLVIDLIALLGINLTIVIIWQSLASRMAQPWISGAQYGIMLLLLICVSGALGLLISTRYFRLFSRLGR